MKDIQNSPDTRGIAIDQVGVCDLLYPITVLDRENQKQQCAAKVSLSVSLPHHFKGTHMSRFLQVLAEHQGEFTMNTVPSILHDLKKRLDAETAHIEVEFPYFIQRQAPVSGLSAPMDYLCTFIGESNGTKDDFLLRVRVPVGTLCPCSKEISDYGAHNQRGYVTITTRTRKKPDGKWDFLWIEELVEVAEKSASAPIYPLLKRTDERHVTMQAYDNPVFVEDVVRNAAAQLQSDPRIEWFEVRAVNHESIHNHSAFAVVRSNNPSRDEPAWWDSLDTARQDLLQKGSAGWKKELARRSKVSPPEIPSGSKILEKFAIAIAYSQSAPSDKVGELLSHPAFRKAFCDFDVKKLGVKSESDLIKEHWKPPMTCLRFKGKFGAIIQCAKILRDIEKEKGSFEKYLKAFAIPQLLKTEKDLQSFWKNFDRLQKDLKKRGMPFFANTTSLLQLLMDLGFDSIKPDLVVMRVAKNWGIVPKATGERNLRRAVEAFQKYGIRRGCRPLAIDWEVLTFGAQKGAKAVFEGTMEL